ncbi:MAG TPA: acyl-ACP thioesterase domain-containing protein [Spirochaetia bacterium]|nr:acyl-ACP thioesterase domain-containing protein [Spirochaetia bacterium]
MSVFTASYPIHTYEADANGRAPFAAIFRFLQDIAAQHAVKIGYGLDDLKENAHMWVLSRFLYRAHRIPRWQEVLEIETWPSGTQRLFALRDWIIRNSSGEEVAIATSSWVVVDIEKRTPVRIERVAERLEMIVDRHLFDRSPTKLPTYDLSGLSLSTTATFADMDLNAHVNSTRYVEWMFNTLPDRFLEAGNVLREIEINFNGESRAGDELGIFTERGPTPTHHLEPESVEFHHSVIKKIDGSIVCRARSLWNRVLDGDKS